MAAEIDPRTGLEVLNWDECIWLLAQRSLGRIAVVLDGQPLVYPVNFGLDGHTVVLRTSVGTKLHGALQGRVAFECDGTDDAKYHTAWSVLATGDATEVLDPAEVERLNLLPLLVWYPGPKSIWLRIRPATLTGRRIVAHRD